MGRKDHQNASKRSKFGPSKIHATSTFGRKEMVWFGRVEGRKRTFIKPQDSQKVHLATNGRGQSVGLKT
ncbi:MAG TPA: hypothetical protein DIU09_00290 [Hyphomonadaceae bacterium]|nr:hypothetical protein AEM38_03355 [Hyphomonadaceae bacterium UKL13-1]HCP63006.1 hypothetical protein [Hyphomonadaceae bacterium]